ncbi:MAG: zinc ribbon domain-containing protein [Acutalibacteraceae bacterium]
MKKLAISLLLVLTLLMSVISPAMALMVEEDSTVQDNQIVVSGGETVDPNFDTEIIPDTNPVIGNEVTLEEGVIPDFPVPEKLYCHISELDGHQKFSVFFTPSEELRAFYYRYLLDEDAFLASYSMDTFIGLGVQLDLSVGSDNAWQFDNSWDEFIYPSGELPKFIPLTSSAVEYNTVWDLSDDNVYEAFKELNENCVKEVEDPSTGELIRKFNTDEIPFYVRVRYYMEYLVPGTEEDEEAFVSRFKLSDWGEEAVIGKGAPEETTLAMPETVDPPVISNLSMMRTTMDASGIPYLNFDISVPFSAVEAEKYLRFTSDFGITKISAEMRIGEGEWQECEIVDSDNPLYGMERTIEKSAYPEAFNTTEELTLRVRYEYTIDSDTQQTEWSNEVTYTPAEFEPVDPSDSEVDIPTATDPIPEQPSDVPPAEEPKTDPEQPEEGIDYVTIGAVVAIIVLLVILLLLTGKKKCPGCGEKVKKSAETCPKCGHVFESKKKNKKDSGDDNGAQQQQQQDYYQQQQQGYYDENGNYYDNNSYQEGYDNNNYYDNNAGYADMVYCPNCGAANQPGTPYCNSCGCQLQ